MEEPEEEEGSSPSFIAPSDGVTSPTSPIFESDAIDVREDGESVGAPVQSDRADQGSAVIAGNPGRGQSDAAGRVFDGEGQAEGVPPPAIMFVPTLLHGNEYYYQMHVIDFARGGNREVQENHNRHL